MSVKKFGARDINLTSSSGTPNITSPNILEINAQSVAISTDLSIGGDITSDIQVVGVATFQDDVVLTSGNLNVTGGALFTGDVQSTSTGFSFLAGNGTNTATDDFSYLSDGEIVVNRLSNSTAFQASSSGTLGVTIDSDGEANFSINNAGGVVNVGPYQNSNNTFGGVSLFSVGAVKANRPSGQEDGNVWLGTLNGGITSRIYAGGDAHFNGNVGVATNVIKSSEALKVQGDAIVTGIVSATSFIGSDLALSGDQLIDGNLNVTGITTSLEFDGDLRYYDVSSSGASNINHYVGFVTSGGSSNLIADNGFTYNPSVNRLSLGGVASLDEIVSFYGLTVTNGAGKVETPSLIVTGISSMQGNMTFQDGNQIQLGNDNDFQIFENSTDGNLRCDNGNIVLRTDREVRIMNALANSYVAQFSTLSSGQVSLYYDGNIKFRTINDGVEIFNNLNLSNINATGIITANTLDLNGVLLGGSDGSNLTSLYASESALSEYASHSQTSNSAHSLSGISTQVLIASFTGSNSLVSGDEFGYDIATSADGKTVVASSKFSDANGTDRGAVYVFDREGSNYIEVAILTGSDGLNDHFGESVATSADGKTIIVGAPQDEQAGAQSSSGLAYVYDRVGNSFNQVGILTGVFADGSNDNFGRSVATSADGKTIVVGARYDEAGAATDTGLVYIYDRNGEDFNQVGIITGSRFSTIDQAGFKVDLSADGKVIAFGSPSDEGLNMGASSGIVYVYDRNGNNFNEVGILTGSYANSNDRFGSALSMSADGKTIAVGAFSDELPTSPAAAGLVYVFDRVGNDFNEVGAFSGSVSTDSSDYFGWDVSLSADGNTLLVGAYIDEAPGAPAGSGAAYLFNRQGNTFNEINVFESPIFATGSDAFGYSVELSADGKTAYVGAIRDEISATDNGVVHAYDIVEETYVNLDTEGNAIFNSTGSIQIPVGTTAERLGIAATGQIRYNTDLSSFEGYGPGGAWGSLGGVKDVDGDTYILAETSAGSDEDTLYFYSGGQLTGTISSTSQKLGGIGIDPYIEVEPDGIDFVGVSTFANNVNISEDLEFKRSFVETSLIQDRTWSTQVSGSFDRPMANAFDEVSLEYKATLTGVEMDTFWARTTGNAVLVTIPVNPPLTVNNSILVSSSYDHRYTFTIDGVVQTIDSPSDIVTFPSDADVTFYPTRPGSLSQITIQNLNPAGRTYLSGIKIDGVRLADTGITPRSDIVPKIKIRTDRTGSFFDSLEASSAVIDSTLRAQEFYGDGSNLTLIDSEFIKSIQDSPSFNEDFGKVWSKVELTGIGAISSIVYCGNGIVLVSNLNNINIYRSTDYGQTFISYPITTDTPPSGGVYDAVISLEYAGNGVLFAGTGNTSSTGDGQVLKSTDYGLTWRAPQIGDQFIISPFVNQIKTIAYCGDNIVLAGGGFVDDGTIYRSTNLGEIWSFGFSTGTDSIEKILYCGNGVVLAGTSGVDNEGDIYRSTNNGSSWTKIEMGSTLNGIQSLVYCGNGIVLAGSGSGTNEGDIYRSTDTGLTWTQIEMGSTIETIESLVYCGNGIVFAGGGTGGGDGNIYKSTDFGLTWSAGIEIATNLDRIEDLVYCGNGILLSSGGNGSGDGDIYRSDMGFGQASTIQGIYHEHLTGDLYAYTNGNEHLRLDSAGRLLVGATSSSSDVNTIFQGSSTSNLCRVFLSNTAATSGLSADNVLGNLSFRSSDENEYASIQGVVDAATAANDYPGRLVFSTTADGDPSPTERLRITNNGDSYFTNKLAVNTTTIDATAALNVAGHIYPSVDATHDLGAPTRRWNNIYTTDLKLSNEGSQNDVDGTWGNYTIQEGEEELYLINHRNGKKYKFMLQEVN